MRTPVAMVTVSIIGTPCVGTPCPHRRDTLSPWRWAVGFVSDDLPVATPTPNIDLHVFSRVCVRSLSAVIFNVMYRNFLGSGAATDRANAVRNSLKKSAGHHCMPWTNTNSNLLR